MNAETLANALGARRAGIGWMASSILGAGARCP